MILELLLMRFAIFPLLLVLPTMILLISTAPGVVIISGIAIATTDFTFNIIVHVLNAITVVVILVNGVSATVNTVHVSDINTIVVA